LAATVAGAFELSLKPGDSWTAARDTIRSARSGGKIAAGEAVSVTLEPGDYMASETLELDASDSGAPGSRVVWQARKPGTVRVLGGRKIPRAAFGKIKDPSVRARLVASVRDRVLVCDASPYLVKEPPTWPDRIDEVCPGPWLYCNGEPQTLARWPNATADGKGWCTYSNVLENAGWQSDTRAGKPAVLEFPDDRIGRWRIEDGVWITGYLEADWYCETLRIGSYDATTHGARFAAISRFGVGTTDWQAGLRRFFAQNLLEEIDSPGEWYLDRKAGKLYWYPKPATGGDEIVLAQPLTPFVRASGASHVAFSGISFAYSHGDSALVFTNCTGCAVANGDFSCHSAEAVVLSGRENRLVGSHVRNNGATAVRLDGGDRRWLLPANNAMLRCTVENYGMFKRAAFGIDVFGCGNAIRECVISNAPYIAIRYWGNEHLFANNRITRVALEAHDTGAIYTGRDSSWLGTVIFGNHFSDLAKTDYECRMRQAIYFDDCDWGDDVIGNTFERTGSGVAVCGGKLHAVCNNLMKDCRCGVSFDSRGRTWRLGDRASFHWDREGKTFARRGVEGMDVFYAPWHVVYPQLEEALDNRPELPLLNEVKGNVICGCEMAFSRSCDAAGVVCTNGNTVLARKEDAPSEPPQPIAFSDAAKNVLASEDGGTKVRIGLDLSGHFSWSVENGGRRVLAASPLGVTVGDRDFGHKCIPGPAVERGDAIGDAPWVEGETTVSLYSGECWRPGKTPVDARRWREWRIPLRNLVTAEVEASLEVRVWKGGAAVRWRVPGDGNRKVYGENTAFCGLASDWKVAECERPKGYPDSFLYPRGEATGVSFPEFPRGWMHAGELVTPWRVITAK